jgi:hypothetical protein
MHPHKLTPFIYINLLIKYRPYRKLLNKIKSLREDISHKNRLIDNLTSKSLYIYIYNT